MVKIVNQICDYLFNEILGFGAHDNVYQFQGFLCLMNILLSSWPILCYFIYSTDFHVVFWLGPVPQYVNLMVPVCLLCLNLGVNYFGFFNKSMAHTARLSCFLLFLIIGSVLLGAGLYVVTIAEQAANELIAECGQTTLTAKLDGEWARLNAFYDACDPTRKKEITQCPGFSETFPNRVYINYLEQLEYEFQCVGFCQFWAKPIFSEDAELGKRCASTLGKHVGAVSAMVGFPTAIQGAAMILIGICLSGYEHL